MQYYIHIIDPCIRVESFDMDKTLKTLKTITSLAQEDFVELRQRDVTYLDACIAFTKQIVEYKVYFNRTDEQFECGRLAHSGLFGEPYIQQDPFLETILTQLGLKWDFMSHEELKLESDSEILVSPYNSLISSTIKDNCL